jgi:hypothetical protein
MTNSYEVYKELEGNCLYLSDTSLMFDEAMKNRLDYGYIKRAMLYVKENHTYVNRIQSIMSLV